MIKKLSNRIFWLITVALSIVVLGLIILFAFFNYNNTINTATLMMDRVIGSEPKRNPNNRLEEEGKRPNIDGMYYILIENNTTILSSESEYEQEIIENAIKVAKKSKQKGIIGKYIYKTRRLRENTVSVILMENERAILHIKTIFLLSILLAILSVIMIYIIAKKLSNIIVKPVEETFEKQKQFISDASHELKTPLTVIEANVDVLENEIGNNKWMGYIQNEIASMNQLINELLLLAKIENIDNMAEYKQFDLSKEIEIILSMSESMAYEKQIKMRTNIQENITMNGKKEDIEHIVSTLLDNAIKHTQEKNEVMVELKKEKNDIILQVKNAGEPIPEVEREKIFERFYRVDQARSRKEKRYGLGLAIAKSTVQKYNGKIEVNFQNGFTIFQVKLPS